MMEQLHAFRRMFISWQLHDTGSSKRPLTSLCSFPELIPKRWGIFEPIKTAFNPQQLDEVASASVACGKHVRTLVFLVRKSKPRFWGSIDLVSGPIHRLRHNCVSLRFNEGWAGIEATGPTYLEKAAGPGDVDFAYVANPELSDYNRYEELLKPYTPEEIRQGIGRAPPFIPERHRDGTLRLWFDPIEDKMLGPKGYLWDVVWYNYFGRIYVDLIGKDRLIAAGWERVEEVGHGLACYATNHIDDPDSFEKRGRIRGSLEEFYWTPGCNPESKRAPVFDFSEQLAALPPEFRVMPSGPGKQRFIFAGFTKEEIQRFEETTGLILDREAKSDSATLPPE